MKKLYKQWKYARLRTWLIVFFLMFSIIPLGVLGIIVFRLSKAELTKQAQEHFWQNAKNTSALLDNELDYIEEFSLKMNADSRLYDIFRELDTENGLQLEEASKQITRILLNYLPWNNSVYSTHLVTSYYRFGEEEKNFYPKNSFVESGMLRQAREADGKLVWIPTYNYVEMFQINGINQNNLEYKRLFSAVRRLNPSNISSGRILHLDSDVERPYLVVNFTEENLRSMLREYVRKESEAQYFVVTEQGEVVCSSYGDGDGEFADITVEDIGISAESDCVRRKISGEDYIIAYAESEVTGWYVVAALPVKILTEKIADNLMRVILALILLMTVLSFGISFIISNKFNRKIYKPLNMIESVGAGDFNTVITYHPLDEFAFFYQKLNEMNQNLKSLVHENYEVKLQKRDTEIMALNIQMNPHFLYNSLNIINWACMKGDSKKASGMLLDLSRMLQYTSQNRELMVSLREDLDWLERYLGIMGKRYEQRFRAGISVPDSMGRLQVPKLFLQPFVENAIIHAFKDYQEDGEIRIFAEEEKEDIVFYVEDNGCGILQEKITEIFGQKNNSIGIQNTDKRLRMIYGEKYGVSISSQVGEGTTVFIRIPDSRKRYKIN